ncbi:MAG: hypothetical protein EAX86_04085 [Candidatus Heimdallarchaeota archaeon]|nr:hypothetical protein [Candidatus Heimdallarchaeota archaeon]
MNLLEILGTWFIVAFLGITLAAPLGPINVEMIKQALNISYGHKVAWLSSILIGIGAMTGDFFMAFMALTIGGETLEDIFSNPLIKLILFVINILILGYLGISSLLKKTEGIISIDNTNLISTSKNQINISRYLSNRYITGLSVVISSPWSYLWWISAGTIILFSDFNAPDLVSRLIIVLMFLSGILAWVLIFTTFLAVIRRSPNPRFFNWITKGSAIILLFFAILIIGEAVESLEELLSLN